MNKEMLSSGDWMCHGCVVHRKRREQRKEQINGLLECQLVEQLSSPVPEPEVVAMWQQASVAQWPTSTPASSTSTDTATPSEPNDADEEDLLGMEEKAPGSDPDADTDGPQLLLKRPFKLLIATATERISTQFQLPGNLLCTMSLPASFTHAYSGTSKWRMKDEATGRNMKRPKHKLDPYRIVPLPVKVCFSCGRSC
ncbi:PHD finger protein 12 isoform X1 [Arapaima gigas]